MAKKRTQRTSVVRGVVWGVAAGLFDVVPMIMQGLPLVADFSAFIQWVVIGLFVATVDIGLRGILKGIVVAVLAVIPVAILVGAQELMSLIPIASMTLILGGALGHILDR